MTFFSKRLLPWLVIGSAFLSSGCSQLTQNAVKSDLADAHPSTPSKLPLSEPVITETQETDAFENSIQSATQRFNALQSNPSLSNHLDQALVFSTEQPTYQNLWDEIGGHLFLTPANTDKYEDYMTYYLRKKQYLKRVSVRAKPYMHFILQEVKKRQMPYEIALLPVVESGFYPYARSHMSAAGLWQFMPATGRMYGLHQNWWFDGRQDVYLSTLAALDYLQALYAQNNHDWLLALASYNSGYGNVLKAQRKYLSRHPDGVADFWNIRPYLPRETQNYVPQLLAISNLVSHKDSYQLELEPIPNQPYFKKIQVNEQISLPKVAQATQTPQDILKILNPGYLRLATPPQGNHHLLLPLDVATAFEVAYVARPGEFEVNWHKHRIRPGESLSVIAERYGTSVREIQNLNRMKSTFLRAGKPLLIPLPQHTQFAQGRQGRAVQPSKTQRTAQPNPRTKTHRYTVRSGDSLWRIAKAYNTTPKAISALNGISLKKPIYKGQQLTIPVINSTREVLYTLKPGESLWVVAQKYRVTTQQLSNWNNINENAVLHPGTQLTVWIQS